MHRYVGLLLLAWGLIPNAGAVCAIRFCGGDPVTSGQMSLNVCGLNIKAVMVSPCKVIIEAYSISTGGLFWGGEVPIDTGGDGNVVIGGYSVYLHVEDCPKCDDITETYVVGGEVSIVGAVEIESPIAADVTVKNWGVWEPQSVDTALGPPSGWTGWESPPPYDIHQDIESGLPWEINKPGGFWTGLRSWSETPVSAADAVSWAMEHVPELGHVGSMFAPVELTSVSLVNPVIQIPFGPGGSIIAYTVPWIEGAARWSIVRQFLVLFVDTYVAFFTVRIWAAAVKIAGV